ncbi:MAG TPA: hypothetical protein VIK56_07570 [Rhodoferax sp.]
MGWLAGVHGAHFIVKNNTLAIHLSKHLPELYGLPWQHRFGRKGICMLVSQRVELNQCHGRLNLPGIIQNAYQAGMRTCTGDQKKLILTLGWQA